MKRLVVLGLVTAIFMTIIVPVSAMAQSNTKTKGGDEGGRVEERPASGDSRNGVGSGEPVRDTVQPAKASGEKGETEDVKLTPTEDSEPTPNLSQPSEALPPPPQNPPEPPEADPQDTPLVPEPEFAQLPRAGGIDNITLFGVGTGILLLSAGLLTHRFNH